MKTAYIFIAWFGVMLALSLAGVFDTPSHPPVPILLAVLIPILLYVFDKPFFGGVIFDGIDNLGNSTTVLWQADRIVGAAFLIEFARGHLPSGFALPAGIGDVLVGVAAPWVAANLSQHARHAARIALWWNYLGILDLVVALSMGVTHSGSLLGIFAQATSMRPIGQYPLSLIPTWAVPLAIILHLHSLTLLRAEKDRAKAGGKFKSTVTGNA